MESIVHFVSAHPQNTAGSLVSPELILGIIGATVTLVSLIWSKYLEKKENLVKELRDKKKPLYENMIKIILKIKASPNDKKLDLSKEILALAGDMMIWASDDVLKQWILLVKIGVAQISKEEEKYEGETIISQIDVLLRAIRKDLGHKNRDIKKDEIISMLFSNVNPK